MSIASLDAPLETEIRAPQRGIWSRPPLLIKCLVVMDLAIGGLAVLSHGIGKLLGTGKMAMFRLGQENNLPTWYSSSQLLLVGMLLILFARDRFERLGRFDWRLALGPSFFLLLSLDETASLHERMGAGLEWLLASVNAGTGMRVGQWTLICGPLFLVGLYFLARFTRPYWAHSPRVKWKFLIGFGICFVSAVGGELVMSAVPADSLAEKVETLLEETGEMIGVTILVWAALDLLAHEGRIHRRATERAELETTTVDD